jgi:acylphosphatase
MIASDDDKSIDVVVQGDEEEIERMTKALGLKEKGMLYVPGILEKMT